MTANSFFLTIGVLLPAVMIHGNILNTQVEVEWRTYRNLAYGYEICYPEEFDVWPTGPVDERDGRSIRIMRHEYEAPTPVLDIHVNVDIPSQELLTDHESPRDMDITQGSVEIGGISARTIEYRWKANGEVVFLRIYLENIVIEFDAHPGLRDVRETIWWKIISTFRFVED